MMGEMFERADPVSEGEVARRLLEDHIPSRVRARDASVYAFSEAAQATARETMGWTTLASAPAYPIVEIERFAAQVRADGFESVLLIGEGGSSQAPMTVTKYNKPDGSGNLLDFKVLDTVSPVRVREIEERLDLAKTLVIVSSKSGLTIEVRSNYSEIRRAMAAMLPPEEVPAHLVAITDAGSPLEQAAREQGWRKVFLGVPSVGGRYSALSVFTLVPAALVGLDIRAFLASAAEAERECGSDHAANPAVKLASFLYSNYTHGRDKFCFCTPKRGRVFGLWIEQLIAESLGKDGKGIVPNIEIDMLTLANGATDRCAIVYETKTDLWDERRNFERGLACIASDLPVLVYNVESAINLASHLVIWEYATAFLGHLLQVCPFDQPYVAAAKRKTLEVLDRGCPEPDIVEPLTRRADLGDVRVWRHGLAGESLDEVLRSLFCGLAQRDWVSVDAFVPFAGEGRREALEGIRHEIAESGHVCCLEIGPRYLHSTGQLQKGGANDVACLIVSADEFEDIPLDGSTAAPSLGALAYAQACGDAQALAERGRRVVHVHLPDNSGAALRALESAVRRALQ